MFIVNHHGGKRYSMQFPKLTWWNHFFTDHASRLVNVLKKKKKSREFHYQNKICFQTNKVSASHLVNTGRCWKGSTLERAWSFQALAPHLPLGIASIWLFLTCLLNVAPSNISSQSPAHGSVPGTYTWHIHVGEWSVTSLAILTPPAIVCLMRAVVQLPQTLCATYSVIIHLESTEQGQERFPLSRYSHPSMSHSHCIDLKSIFKWWRFLHLMVIVPICEIYSHYFKCQLCYPSI